MQLLKNLGTLHLFLGTMEAAINRRSLPKAKFTAEDDTTLMSLVERLGENAWAEIADMMKGRTQRQCKERWFYYLSPKINSNEWTKEEDELLMAKYEELGSKWVTIARFMDRRTDAQCKNRVQKLLRGINRAEKLRRRQQNSPSGSEPSAEAKSPIHTSERPALQMNLEKDEADNQIFPEQIWSAELQESFDLFDESCGQIFSEPSF